MAPTPAKKEAKSAAVAPKTKAGKDGKVKKAQGRSRNYVLAKGIVRFSKSKMYHKKAKYVFKGKKFPAPEPKPKKQNFVVKKIGGEKNGESRVIFQRKRKSFYPTQQKIRDHKHKNCFSKHTRYTRKNMQPGRLLILLAGRHKGKRVVLVKVLPSGLLLVTGPFKANGCPLRRINQRYVIGTSTRLDISKVKVPEHLDDAYFKKNKKSAKRSVKRKEGEDIFSTKKEKYVASEQRKTDQKAVDNAILGVIKKHADRRVLRKYLSSMFGLRSSQYPHRMKF